MKSFKLLFFILASFFVAHQSNAQSSRISIMKEIGKMESDLIISINNLNTPKQLEAKIKLVKDAVEDAEFEYARAGNQIKEFSFQGSGHGCASDKFELFVIAIKDGEVQSCYVADKKE